MTSERNLLIVANTAAGSVDDDLIATVEQELAGRCQFELRQTTSRNDLAGALSELDERRLLVIGGDGSVHTVAAVLNEQGLLGSAVVGLIPTGTGNDLARSLGIPFEVPEAIDVALADNLRHLDILDSSGGNVVVNVVHVGVGADAAQAGKSVKGLLGAAGYTVGAVAAGVRATGWEVTIEVDGHVVTEPPESILMAAVAVGATIGGGTPIAPEAVVDDGLAEVMVSSATGPLSRVSFASDLRSGDHAEREDVLVTRAKTVRIFGEGFPVNTDGELESDVTDRTWTVRPGAWTLAVPPGN